MEGSSFFNFEAVIVCVSTMKKKKNQNFSILNQTFSNLLHLASLACAPSGVYERRDIVVRAERQLSDKERILSAYHI